MISKRTSAPELPQRESSSSPALGGCATLDGTARFASRFAGRFAADFFRSMLRGPMVSSIGLGTYLGECGAADDEGYEIAVRGSVARGVNLFDTAINYRCQRSERVVGAALRTIVAEGTAARDEIVLCSKGGYIPLDGCVPPDREAYQEYLRREYFEPGILAPDQVVGGGHSLAPSFLADQLSRSRANLGVETIDLYYLHNPEQQIHVLKEEEFTSRLRAAFELLESRVEAGEIGAYGCATWNGFRVPPGARTHLSLPALVALARQVAGEGHHFRAVQLPISLAMMEAVREPTQRLPGGRKVTLLEAAAELGIDVVASATLMQAQLTHGLPAELHDTFPEQRTDAQRAIAFVRALPQVASALVGMRRSEHLDENLGAAAA